MLHHPLLATAYDLAQQFTRMVRERRAAELDGWLERSQASPISDLAQFASGLRSYYQAVLAGLTWRWISGPVEGNVTRLKLIKRQRYGRAHLDLFRIRVFGET